MYSQNIFYPKGLLVLGRLNRNKNDRLSHIKNPQLVQFIYNNRVYPIKHFSDWHDISVSSLCWAGKSSTSLYVTSTTEIYEYNLKNGTLTNLCVSGLEDIHEITYKNGFIWIANTGKNSLVCYNPELKKIEKTYDLMPFKKDEKNNGLDKLDDDIEIEIKDEFHVNQVFFDYNDNLSALVHHVNGRQLRKRNRLQNWIKKQGNGGIIGIKNKVTRPLHLSSPHSVRLINGSYYICDSAVYLVKNFDKNWRFQSSMSTEGYPRGMDYCPKKNLLFIGNSTIRRRYRDLLQKKTFNNVEIFNLNDHKLILRIKIDNLEQINNLYLMDEYQSKLLACSR